MSSLKELTAVKHKEAESQPFIKSIFAGTVDNRKYAEYLYQLLCVYGALESHARMAGVLKGMETIQRAKDIELDWIELIGTESSILLPETKKYMDYMSLGSFWNYPDKIMAHIYVRHMGDLFGGQMLAKLVPGQCRMYKFDDRETLITEMRKRLTLDMAEEANTAFQFNIDIIKAFND